MTGWMWLARTVVLHCVLMFVSLYLFWWGFLKLHHH